MPQAAYYALVSVHSAREGRAPPAVIVPSGNVGNACAALWVKAMGLPLGRVHLAALDEDPVLAVSGVAARRDGRGAIGVHSPRAVVVDGAHRGAQRRALGSRAARAR